MVDFSRDERRSTASFAISFIVHFALILCFALVFFQISGNETISLNVLPPDETDAELSFQTPAVQYETSAADTTVLETVPRETAELKINDLDELLGEADFEEESFMLAGRLLTGDGESALEVEPSSGFFGIEPVGDRIVYVIDMSVSMRYRSYHGRRYDQAVAEVLKSIDQLKPEQKFYVYLFCFQKFEMNIGQYRGQFCAPTATNKNRLRRWLHSVDLGSGTDPRESLVSALRREPTCVFLLSDGEFNGRQFNNGQFGTRHSAVELAKENNKTGCPIHTIGLEDLANQRDLTLIAEQSGGKYKFITQRDGPADN